MFYCNLDQFFVKILAIHITAKTFAIYLLSKITPFISACEGSIKNRKAVCCQVAQKLPTTESVDVE